MKRIIKISMVSLLVMSVSVPVFALLEQNLKYGNRNNDVMELQDFLIDKNMLAGSASGFFGITTLKAVKKYQKSAGIPSTGYVGFATREKINKAVEKDIATSIQAEIKETGTSAKAVDIVTVPSPQAPAAPAAPAPTAPNFAPAQVTAFKGRAIDATDYVEGDKDSRIVVIEYSDPECPFCIRYHPTMKQLRAEYKGKIAFIYRHYPLTQIHPQALDLAKTLACAGKVGGATKYYDYLTAYYDNRSDAWKKVGENAGLPPFSSTGKEDIAKLVGLDVSAFNSCVKNNDTEKIVQDSITDGNTLDAQGLPLVNGVPATFVLKKTATGYDVVGNVPGAYPYESVKAAIDQAFK